MCLERQLRVLISDPGDVLALLLKEALTKAGIWTLTCRQEADTVIGAVRAEHPDLLVLNLTVPTADFAGLADRLHENSDLKIIALYRQENLYLESLLSEQDVFCRRIPEHMNTLTETVLSVIRKPEPALTLSPAEQSAALNLEWSVTNMLQAACVPFRLIGFHYLRRAILLCWFRPELLLSPMSSLYPEIAKYYRSSVSGVERAIRNALDQAWETACASKQYSPLQFPLPHRMSSTAFISYALDLLRLEQENLDYQ